MILDQIVEYKKEELDHFKRQISLEEIKAKAKDSREPISLKEALLKPRAEFSVISEIKHRSPSKGIIREKFDPVQIARDYLEHGATALSILTDEHFFGGHLDHLRVVRGEVNLPILRKDFLWDPYQVYSALDAGADAILLIVAMLEQNQLEDLQGLADELGLSVLVEVHDPEECNVANAVGAKIVGVNNRDLKTFKIDVANSEKLFPLLNSAEIRVSESGIGSREILVNLSKAGAGAFLIGESLLRAENPGEALEELMKSSK